MKIFTIIQGIRFSMLMKLVFRNGITLYPRYILRFLVLLQAALISSIFTLVERFKYSKKLRRTELVRSPLFIIGHWRTGSTFLHQLFNLDPQFTAPNMVQTVIPDHFLVSTRYYVPILKGTMPETRPMDNVNLSPFEPQEEEFALIRMGSVSPVEKLLFPSGTKYFLEGYNQYLPTGRKLKIWEKNLRTLFKKITLQTGKQIVSKNPFHTLRLPLLASMFPGAKFIHITRDPLVVVPSTVRMWNIVAAENCLKRGWKKPTIGSVASVLGSYLTFVKHESRNLEKGHFIEVAFEDLEKDPQKELERIYTGLNLTLTEEFINSVNQFLEDNKNYRKNRYELNDEEKKIILSGSARNSPSN